MNDFAPEILERFYAKTVTEPPTSRWFWNGESYEQRVVTCLRWIGAQHNKGKGYGRFQSIRGKFWVASRYIYTQSHGEIPEGMEVDHLCVNTECVNAEHLEAVTGKENIRRSTLYPHPRRISPVCPKGHTWAENIGYQRRTLRDGSTAYYRFCAQCNRDTSRRAYVSKPRKPREPTTHCINGHERTSENTYTAPNGKLSCVPCNRAAVDRYRARKMMSVGR